MQQNHKDNKDLQFMEILQTLINIKKLLLPMTTFRNTSF